MKVRRAGTVLADADLGVVRGAIVFLAVRGVGVLLTLGLQFMLARWLGVERFGVYAYALTLVALVAIVAPIGMDAVAVRFAAIYATRGDWTSLRALQRFGTRYVLAASVVGVTLIITAVWVTTWSQRSLQRCVVIGLIGVPFVAAANFRYGLLRGLGRIVASELPEGVLRPLLMALLLVGTGLTAVGQVDEESAVLIWSGTSALLFVVAGWWMTRSARTWRAAPVAAIGPEAWTVAGLPLLAISVLHVLLDRLGIVMLGYLGSTTDAGIYSVAGRFAEIISFGLAAVNSRLGPTIAAAYDRGRRDDMQRAASTALRLSLLIAFGTCLVLVPFGQGILRLYGTAFVAGYVPLLVLLAGQAINAACGSVGTIIVMTSHRAQLAMVLLASLAANAVLNMLLIPRFGMLGAAAATAVSMAAWNLALLSIVHRRLRIRPGIL